MGLFKKERQLMRFWKVDPRKFSDVDSIALAAFASARETGGLTLFYDAKESVPCQNEGAPNSGTGL
jgi:hypothetical protein